MAALAVIAERRGRARAEIVETVNALAARFDVPVPDNLMGTRLSRDPLHQRLHQEEAIAAFLVSLKEKVNA